MSIEKQICMDDALVGVGLHEVCRQPWLSYVYALSQHTIMANATVVLIHLL